MKKLIIVIGLFVVSPVVAMELALITKQDIHSFASHITRAIDFGNRKISDKQLSANNPIHVMLSKISDDLKTYDNDVLKMISADNDLLCRIKKCSFVDSNPLVKFGLEQIKSGLGDSKAIEEYVITTRQFCASLELKNIQKNYSPAWMGEVQTQGRIGFMLRNEKYPLDKNAMKDYIATFIYQTLFAVKI